ncbi:MAG: 5' nucleotidase, NT5C type [Acidimicrobiales bacterium]
MLCGLDLDGVLCDLGPSVADRIADAFGVASHPSTWRSYDLRLLRLGIPEDRFSAFLDHTFADPSLYGAAPVCEGVHVALGQLRQSGWDLVGITARPAHLAEATRAWLARHRLPVEEVHHTPVGTKSEVARRLGVDATIEDNPAEAELLADVCDSWLIDRPYNLASAVVRARRLSSWDDAVGRLCQLRFFA